MRTLARPGLLWLAAVVLVTLGTALVFAGVTGSGLFMPGVVLIDVGLGAAVAAGVLQVSGDEWSG